MDDHHLQKSIRGWQELSHYDLQQGLPFEISFFSGEFDLKLSEKGGDFFLLVVHARLEDSEDRIQAELVESTL